MGDFDTDRLASDWGTVVSRAGALSFTIGGASVSGVWSQRINSLESWEEQLRDERRFTVFATMATLPTTPTTRMTIARAGVTYAIEAVRHDAEGVGIELDVKQIL